MATTIMYRGQTRGLDFLLEFLHKTVFVVVSTGGWCPPHYHDTSVNSLVGTSVGSQCRSHENG